MSATAQPRVARKRAALLIDDFHRNENVGGTGGDRTVRCIFPVGCSRSFEARFRGLHSLLESPSEQNALRRQSLHTLSVKVMRGGDKVEGSTKLQSYADSSLIYEVTVARRPKSSDAFASLTLDGGLGELGSERLRHYDLGHSRKNSISYSFDYFFHD